MVADIRETVAPDMSAPSRSLCGNERGAALIIVLVMLMLLMILGSTLLSSSTTDLQIAGNYRNNQNAFYLNDNAYEYLKSPDSEVIYEDNDLITPNASKSFPMRDPVTNEIIDGVNYEVTNVGCLAGAPAGSGNDSDTGNAYNIYAIEIDASGPNNARASTLAGNLYQRAKPCD